MTGPRLLAPAVTFDASLEPLAWGRSTYVVVRLPEALVASAEAVGTRPSTAWSRTWR